MDIISSLSPISKHFPDTYSIQVLYKYTRKGAAANQ